MNRPNPTLRIAPIVSAFALIVPSAAFAAATPALVTAGTYGILSNTYTNTSAGTTVNGDVGFTTPPAVPPAGVQTNYGSGSPYSAAGTDQGAALSSLNAEACTYTFPPGAVNLSTDTTHGAIGIYTPGVYCSSGAMNIGGPLLLNGSGTYIFRPVGALTSATGAVVTLNGGSTCDVFWTPSAGTTLAANTTFLGTVIDDSGISIGANTTWNGRALAFGGTVTTDTDTINAPTCAAVVVVPPAPVTPSPVTEVSTRGFSGQFVNPVQVTSNSTASVILPSTTTVPTMSAAATTTVTAASTSTPLGFSTSTIPGLPNTGLPPGNWNVEEMIALLGLTLTGGFLARKTFA